MSDFLIWQLADSAFPTGSFAHSSGLEAAWQGGEVPSEEAVGAVRRFLHDVIHQAGHASLPLLTAAYRDPARLAELDEMADIFLTNVVANRASRRQGRALLSTCARVWPTAALCRLEAEHSERRGHAAPVTGVVMRELEVSLRGAQRLFLYTAARGVLAAAVRVGIVGSYDAQRLQFESAPVLDAVLERCSALDESSLAQTSPIVDLLQASHDRLYSRLFQS